MANDPMWSRWTPEQHADEAQRLIVDSTGTYKTNLLLIGMAQVHATLCAAKMTDRLDTTLGEIRTEIVRQVR